MSETYKQRLDKYYEISTKLNYLSDNDVKKYFKNYLKKFEGWGVNYIVELDKNKIFIKTLKVTNKEFDNKFDTSNLFNLPEYYNYGIGSAGINVWRELQMHIKTTNFVLKNEFHFFPLLYDYRIIEDKQESTINLDKEYLQRWHNNKNIKKYIDEKNKTKYKLILFLEYIPITLNEYLKNNTKFNYVYNKCYDIIQFMNKKNILHFDSHEGNFLVDDKNNIYITDFGLCIDKEFKLSEKEINFYNLNRNYDINYLTYATWFGGLYNIIMSKKRIKHYENKFNFIWNQKDKYMYHKIINIINDNYEYILETEKIKSDKLSIKKIIKQGFDFHNFFMKLLLDNKKEYKKYIKTQKNKSTNKKTRKIKL